MKASPKVKMTPKMKMSAIVKMTPKMKVTPYTRTTPKIKATSKKTRDERDFGLETETRVVSRLVSRFDTTCQKSQYQSQNLRLISKVSVSVTVSNFETKMQKSQSQSQNVIVGLAHHIFWNPQRKLISCLLFIIFYCIQGQIKTFIFFRNQ